MQSNSSSVYIVYGDVSLFSYLLLFDTVERERKICNTLYLKKSCHVIQIGN